MTYRIHFILTLTSVLLFGTSIWVFAQGNTDTPVPSKTPEASQTHTSSPTASAPTQATTPTLQPSYQLPRAYTQEDLNVLVGNVQRPNGIAYFDNFLYTACNGDWTLYRIDAESGATITLTSGVRNVNQMVVEETVEGFDLWLPDFDTDKLLRVDQSRSAPRTVMSENLDGPWGIAPLADQYFLISNLRADNLIVATRTGESVVVAEGFRSPTGLVIDQDVVYLANNGSARRAIEWFPTDALVFDLDASDAPDISDQDEATIAAADEISTALVSGLQNVSNLVLASDGYLYFSYGLGTRGVVGRVDPNQCRQETCTNEQVEIVLFTELDAPLAGLEITPDMRLYVHTIYRPEIYWVDLYE